MNNSFTNIVIPALMIALVGCSKEEPAHAAAPAPVASVIPALSGTGTGKVAAPAMVDIPADVPVVEMKVDLEALTKGLHEYCRKTQENPENLNDVVRAGFLPALPKLPPGKRLAIDQNTYKVVIQDIESAAQ